jgi:starch synthase
MRAQRYGSLPIARRVGGLADTIEDGATGFLFDAYDPLSLEKAAFRALEQFGRRARWTAMMRAAMARDFSWERSVAAYDAVYRRVVTSASRS